MEKEQFDAPDLRSKVIALCSVVHKYAGPVPKQMIVDSLSEWGVDGVDANVHAQIDEILKGDDFERTERDGVILYAIPPENKSVVEQCIADIARDAMLAMAHAGKKHLESLD